MEFEHLRDNVVGVCAGPFSTFIRTEDDQVWVCGSNQSLELGMEPKSSKVCWTYNPQIDPSWIPSAVQKEASASDWSAYESSISISNSEKRDIDHLLSILDEQG